MKKNIKIAWGILLIISFLIIGYFNFQNSQPLTEQEKEFLLTQWQPVEIILLPPQSGSGTIENKNKSTSQIVNWVEQIIIHQFEWVVSYKWELPDIPNEKLNNSTLLWLDTNNNGVRDDLEVHILRNYWADKMVVEAFFAYVRSNALNKIIQRDWLFTDELYENDIKKRKTLSIWCQWRYFYDSLYNFYSTELYTVAIEFEQKINNTWLREKNTTQFFSNLNNKFWTARSTSEEECKVFLKETKTYKIY
jgi:hypothetical protein